MEIHGIRPEFQPSAQAQASQNASQQALKEEVVDQAVGANHDAPGIDQADASSVTGLGGYLNITA